MRHSKQAHATALKTQLVLGKEIEQLKAAIAILASGPVLTVDGKTSGQVMEEQRALITELADALEIHWPTRSSTAPVAQLIQRAREATKHE